MTHNDIYTKYMIEYDKANVTSSYPLLTKYEIATVLNKAYNALIALKVTGNNYRRAPFEADIKAISDLQGLITSDYLSINAANRVANNVYTASAPSDFLYVVGATIQDGGETNIARIVNHDIAQKFYETVHNHPWVKIPVYYIEKDVIYIVVDSELNISNSALLRFTYIKEPNKFTENSGSTNFECNDTVAEELISLAIIFALENVESQRLNTKLNTRGLEA